MARNIDDQVLAIQGRLRLSNPNRGELRHPPCRKSRRMPMQPPRIGTQAGEFRAVGYARFVARIQACAELKGERDGTIAAKTG